jgi:Fur family ferric uptake transcriptional regulator
MTAACAAPILTARSPEAVLNLLRGNGMRVSTARRAVVTTLFAAGGPVSAEQIAAGLDGSRLEVDLASVYRNLEKLEQLGVVRHFHAGHGPGRYELAGEHEREYLACDRCGAVVEASPEELEPIREEIRKRFGYEVRFTHFPMVGLCAGCGEADL